MTSESQIKNLFKPLQRDEKIVLFTEESINNKVLERLEFAKLFYTFHFSFS